MSFLVLIHLHKPKISQVKGKGHIFLFLGNKNLIPKICHLLKIQFFVSALTTTKNLSGII